MTNAIKRLIITNAIWLISIYTQSAFAHDYSGSLGTAVGATDVYQVSCYNDSAGAPYKVYIQVRDATAGKSILSLQASKGFVVRNTTDAVGGNTAYSPYVSIVGGAGPYNVYVNKTIAGARSYRIAYHCMTSDGAHTGTSIAVRQNQ